MQKETVQVDQTPEHIFSEGTDTVPMQEQMGEVDQIREKVIMQKMELIFLQQSQNATFSAGKKVKSKTIDCI